ncbi:TPA: LPXTG cell wall anchor domain-containing protein [Streptococcus equi subsp. zooepidemicus]|nr:LPXTG cell wall anchor domain-containing protein [Streptococcus equi subsp. zooepidemicus]
MKSCKSTLRKAVMAAMLAGAITTTGGVKANEYNGILENDSELKKSLDSLFTKIATTDTSNSFYVSGTKKDIESILRSANVVDLKVLMSRLGQQGGDIQSYGEKLLLSKEAINLSELLINELGSRITSEESLKKEKSKLEAELTNARDKSAELLSELDEAYKVNEEEGAKNTDLANKLLTAQAEIDQLTADKVKAETDLETANTTITSLQEELAGAKASYDKLSEEKAAADQALAEANARVSELEQQAASANARVADLEVQLAAKTAELDVVKADKAELEAKVKELQDMLQQKDRSNADLQANIERLKQELADKFKDQAQPRSKTPQASNSAAKQKASKPTAKPAGQLPSTGEATANPFFTAAAVAIMTGAGLVTVMPKRQKN